MPSVCDLSMLQALKLGHAVVGHQQEGPHRPGRATNQGLSMKETSCECCALTL